MTMFVYIESASSSRTLFRNGTWSAGPGPPDLNWSFRWTTASCTVHIFLYTPLFPVATPCVACSLRVAVCYALWNHHRRDTRRQQYATPAYVTVGDSLVPSPDSA